MSKILFKLNDNLEIKENLTYRFIGWFSIILVIIPFVGLSLFNYPQAEDFTVTVVSQHNSFLEAIKNWYLGWSGRYTSNSLIILLEPLRYKILPMTLILPLLLLFLLWYSVKISFEKLKVLENKNAIFVATGLSLYLYFHSLPSIFEGYYWTPGSFAYTLPILFSLVNLSWIAEGEISKLRKALIIISVFYIGGSSEITPIVYGLMMIGWISYKLINKEKIDRFIWTQFVLFIIFSLFELLAPGNFKRGSEVLTDNSIPFWDFDHTLSSTVTFLKTWVYIWFFRSPSFLIAGSIFLLINSEIHSQKVKRKIAFLMTFLISTFATVFIPMFFFLVQTKSAGMPNRVTNIVYFCFLVTLLSGIGLLASLLKNDNLQKQGQSLFTQRYALLFLFAGILFSFMNPNKLYKSYEDLFSGRAKRYSQAMIAREELINKSQSDTVIVSKITDIPYSIYLIDICEDPKDWKNEGYAKYFEKKAIIAR